MEMGDSAILSGLEIVMSDQDFERLLIGKSDNTTIPYMRKAKELIIRGLLTRGTDRKAINGRTEIIGGILSTNWLNEGRIYLVEGGEKATLAWKGDSKDFRSNYMRIRDELVGPVPYRQYGRAAVGRQGVTEGTRRSKNRQKQGRTPKSEKTSTGKAPYEILGVKFGASIAEINAAYHRMAQLYHPDKVATLAAEFHELAELRMKEINAAYEVLKKQT